MPTKFDPRLADPAFWKGRIVSLEHGQDLRDAIAVGVDWQAVNLATGRLLMSLGVSGRVLDVGCGLGDVCSLLTPDDLYLGIDFVPEFVREAWWLYPRGAFALADARNLSWLPDRCFDWAISRGVGAGFVKGPDVLPGLLRVAKRVLVASFHADEWEVIEQGGGA